MNKYKPFREKALKIMESIDKKDAPFIALALSIPVDGIWSDDKHFKQQKTIKIFTTKDLIFQFLEK
jgi:predicted nucleic acid-binding protein